MLLSCVQVSHNIAIPDVQWRLDLNLEGKE